MSVFLYRNLVFMKDAPYFQSYVNGRHGGDVVAGLAIDTLCS